MAEAKQFHIETVTAEVLKTIHGIGDVRAEAILSARSICGGVMTAEQFAEVEIPDSVKQLARTLFPQGSSSSVMVMSARDKMSRHVMVKSRCQSFHQRWKLIHNRKLRSH